MDLTNKITIIIIFLNAYFSAIAETSTYFILFIVKEHTCIYEIKREDLLSLIIKSMMNPS
jgi:hypothetical protein